MEVLCFRFIKIKQTYKPGSVESYHLSSSKITLRIKLPTLQHWAHNPQTLVYMAFHLVEFT